MINVVQLLEKAEHALSLLDEVAAVIPGPKGEILRSLVGNVRKAIAMGDIKAELEGALAKASAEAQRLADEWPDEPTKR